MALTDATLARGWQRGDESSARAVVDRYADALGAVAYGILNDLSLAEEAVQESFARASRTIRQLKDPYRIGPWLVAIARNVAYDLNRKRAIRRETPLVGDEVATASSPAQIANRGELGEHIRTVVAQLPEDQRDLFVMKYMADMSYAAIAATLGISPEAVSQKLWRIRRKLQQELQEFRP
jgi:RNA polymerase sigma-70 factor (ECF subfamily)